MLTLHYVLPLSGTRRVGGSSQPWTIDKVAFPPLGQLPAPDETLVKACHTAMRDQDGNKVPLDTLRAHNLKEGLAAAFRAIESERESLLASQETE